MRDKYVCVRVCVCRGWGCVCACLRVLAVCVCVRACVCACVWMRVCWGDEAILEGGKGAAAYIFMLIYNCLTFLEVYLLEIDNTSYEL